MRRTLMVGVVLCVAALLACKKKQEPDPAKPLISSEPEAVGRKLETPPATAVPVGFVGDYLVSGVTPKGGRYSGGLAIDAATDVHTLEWTLKSGEKYGGIGLRAGNLLGVGWGSGADYGVVVYQVDGGRLIGRWASVGSKGQIGEETLEGPPGASGTYAIVSSKNPGGKGSYAGSVVISGEGSLRRIHWNLRTQKFEGIGILKGKTLVVGWGSGDDSAGVVIYSPTTKGLKGEWAQPGGNAVGTEQLTRR